MVQHRAPIFASYLENNVRLQITFSRSSGDSKQLDKLPDRLWELLKTGLLSDFLIITDEKTFAVHKNILASASLKFKAMFSVDMKENRKNALDLSSVDAGNMEKVLDFVYTDRLIFAEDEDPEHFKTTMQLVKLADEHGFQQLKVACDKKLILYDIPIVEIQESTSPECSRTFDIFELLDFAHLYQLEEFKRKVMTIIVEEWSLNDDWAYIQEYISKSAELGQEILKSLGKV